MVCGIIIMVNAEQQYQFQKLGFDSYYIHVIHKVACHYTCCSAVVWWKNNHLQQDVLKILVLIYTYMSMLLAAKFGTGNAVGDVPLHYALKCGMNEDVHKAIIPANYPLL